MSASFGNIVFCLALMGALYGLMVGYAKRLQRHIDKEKRELTKWQIELEREASRIRQFKR